MIAQSFPKPRFEVCAVAVSGPFYPFITEDEKRVYALERLGLRLRQGG